jgi:hypothetical protein
MAFRGNALTFLKLSTLNCGYAVVAGISQVTKANLGRGDHATGSTGLAVLLNWIQLNLFRHLNKG